MAPRAIRFRSADEAAAALEAVGPEIAGPEIADPEAAGRCGCSGGGVLLLSAPGAAAWPGAGVVAAMVARAAALHPGVPHRAALDCGGSPGLALDALRQGWRLLVLDPAHPAFPAVAAAAAEVGAVLLPRAPEALDVAPLDLRRPGGRAILARHLAENTRQDGPAGQAP